MSDNFGKGLVFIGLFILFIGLLIWGLAKIGIPFGRLPGDYSYKGENTSFYFPVVTSIVISVILTIIVNLVLWLMKR